MKRVTTLNHLWEIMKRINTLHLSTIFYLSSFHRHQPHNPYNPPIHTIISLTFILMHLFHNLQNLTFPELTPPQYPTIFKKSIIPQNLSSPFPPEAHHPKFHHPPFTHHPGWRPVCLRRPVSSWTFSRPWETPRDKWKFSLVRRMVGVEDGGSGGW